MRISPWRQKTKEWGSLRYNTTGPNHFLAHQVRIPFLAHRIHRVSVFPTEPVVQFLSYWPGSASTRSGLNCDKYNNILEDYRVELRCGVAAEGICCWWVQCCVWPSVPSVESRSCRRSSTGANWTFSSPRSRWSNRRLPLEPTFPQTLCPWASNIGATSCLSPCHGGRMVGDRGGVHWGFSAVCLRLERDFIIMCGISLYPSCLYFKLLIVS